LSLTEVTDLLKAYPEGITEKDKGGKLPFDLALDNRGSLSLLEILQPGTVAWCNGGEGFQQPDRPLVSAEESGVFESLAHLLDPNPRRLKRIISVYALVTEVAKRVSLSEDGFKAVGDDNKWISLRPKLAKWLCLCECYPYRMSFLVLLITDLVQKEQVNRLRRSHPSLRNGYQLVHYGRGIPSTADESSTSAAGADNTSTSNLELPDNMPIVEAYFRHVERYIYSHASSKKMLSLDGDPELFTALLISPVADLGAMPANKKELCDVTVGDVLGPLKPEGDIGDRDANFSLLTYSFSLNPALRHDLSFEMGQMNSDVGLHFGDAPHDPVLKQEMLFRRKAEMHPTRAADRGFHTAPMMQLPALQRGRASTAPE